MDFQTTAFSDITWLPVVSPRLFSVMDELVVLSAISSSTKRRFYSRRSWRFNRWNKNRSLYFFSSSFSFFSSRTSSVSCTIYSSFLRINLTPSIVVLRCQVRKTCKRLWESCGYLTPPGFDTGCSIVLERPKDGSFGNWSNHTRVWHESLLRWPASLWTDFFHTGFSEFFFRKMYVSLRSSIDRISESVRGRDRLTVYSWLMHHCALRYAFTSFPSSSSRPPPGSACSSTTSVFPPSVGEYKLFEGTST